MRGGVTYRHRYHIRIPRDRKSHGSVVSRIARTSHGKWHYLDTSHTWTRGTGLRYHGQGSAISTAIDDDDGGGAQTVLKAYVPAEGGMPVWRAISLSLPHPLFFSNGNRRLRRGPPRDDGCRRSPGRTARRRLLTIITREATGCPFTRRSVRCCPLIELREVGAAHPRGTIRDGRRAEEEGAVRS